MSAVTRYADRYASRPGGGYDGVGLVAATSSLGSGMLLANGRAVLTEAHVVDDSYGTIRVAFDGVDGRYWATVEEYWIHPGYDTNGYRDDLALYPCPSGRCDGDNPALNYEAIVRSPDAYCITEWRQKESRPLSSTGGMRLFPLLTNP